MNKSTKPLNSHMAVHCRPALPSDTADVLELTSTIWEGQDNIPEVWENWLSDSTGLLAVAEYQGRVLGLSKLTRLSESDWWLDGLRVHPDFEGRGVASSMHDFLFSFNDLASSQGYSKISWIAPLHPDLLPTLEKAGYARDWDDSLYIFARVHPKEFIV